jgi:putative spermidine/putrescine transport system permease protein
VPGLVSTTQFIGNVIVINVAQDLPFAAAYSLVPLAIILVYLLIARRLGAFEAFLMLGGRLGRFRVAAGDRDRLLVFIYVPLALGVVYAFNASGTSKWPPSGFTLTWVHQALATPGSSRRSDVDACALGATAVAMVLGAWPHSRSRATRSSARDDLVRRHPRHRAARDRDRHGPLHDFATFHVPLGFFTIVVGHATFCIVLVYNNAIAGCADSQLVRGGVGGPRRGHLPDVPYVTFPALRSALIAGGLLAFALSFDEVIVTIFMAGGVKTLPIWIFQSFRLANQVPLVNVAGLVAILLSVIPVYLATRLSGGVTSARG